MDTRSVAKATQSMAKSLRSVLPEQKGGADIDPLERVARELMVLEARYETVNEQARRMKEAKNPSWELYREEEEKNLAERIYRTREYATALQAQSINGALFQMHLIGIYLDLVNGQDAPEECDLAALRRMTFSVRNVLADQDETSGEFREFYSNMHTNPFLSFEEALKVAGIETPKAA